MSYSEEQRAAGALAARTARACDSCLRHRARWYCNADDAFLCQACDASVHSANPLARRHHRVRLNGASSSSSSSSRSSSPSSFAPDDFSEEHATPAWLHGLKRKPRTHRGKPGSLAAASKVEPLVPDLEDLSAEENQRPEQNERLLYCVPILDPADLSEFCTQPQHIEDADFSGEEVKPAVELQEYDHVPVVAATPDGLACFPSSADLDLAEFASDMEMLLEPGLDDAFCIDGLSLVNEGLMEDDKGEVRLDTAICDDDIACDFRTEIEEHEHKPPQEVAAKRRRVTILKLDYEAVIAAWSSNGCSPWTAGERPQLDLKDDTWTDVAAIGGGEGEVVRGLYLQQVAMGAPAAVGEAREARVSRYREKRRMRLFSKKIRYEVRKLNAEKRPRIKGRFVKRAAAPATEFPVAAVASAFPYL